MEVKKFTQILGSDFYAGVPDSLLKALCNYLMFTYGVDKNHHLIAANEGNAVAIAAGYHLATGKVPVVYMQNSGEGNIINPVASLLNDKVYGIPMIFVVGWRGEPGVKDEPQHIYQGEVTVRLLDDMDIKSIVLDGDMSDKAFAEEWGKITPLLKEGKQIAVVIRKGALSGAPKVQYKNENPMVREDIIRKIVEISGDDPIVSTTGKASRELFEIREEKNMGHGYDFLTVGSMGHTSSIALGVAINKPDKKVWCIDGDGSMLMHMGAMGVVGSVCPNNLVHIVINNASHETVGGLPTACGNMDVPAIANACGYKLVLSARDEVSLDEVLKNAKESDVLTFVEIKSSIGAREDLGRPTTTAKENKENYMEYLKK